MNSDAIVTILSFSGYAPLNTKRLVSTETGSGIAYFGRSMDTIVIDRAPKSTAGSFTKQSGTQL
jgi:hypothetical protein